MWMRTSIKRLHATRKPRNTEKEGKKKNSSVLKNCLVWKTVEILSSDDEDKELDSKLNIQQNMIEEDRKLAIQIQK